MHAIEDAKGGICIASGDTEETWKVFRLTELNFTDYLDTTNANGGYLKIESLQDTADTPASIEVELSTTVTDVDTGVDTTTIHATEYFDYMSCAGS
jgi:hypothetical protein